MRVTRLSMSRYYPELLSAFISLLRALSDSTKPTRELKPPRTQPFSAALVIPSLHHKKPTQAPQLRFNTIVGCLFVSAGSALGTRDKAASGAGREDSRALRRRGGRGCCRDAAGGAAGPAAAAGPRLRAARGNCHHRESAEFGLSTAPHRPGPASARLPDDGSETASGRTNTPNTALDSWR